MSLNYTVFVGLNILRRAPRKAIPHRPISQPPLVVPSLNPSFIPMATAPNDVCEKIWARVLYFAMSVSDPATAASRDAPRKLPLLLVSKTFHACPIKIPSYCSDGFHSDWVCLPIMRMSCCGDLPPSPNSPLFCCAIQQSAPMFLVWACGMLGSNQTPTTRSTRCSRSFHRQAVSYNSAARIASTAISSSGTKLLFRGMLLKQWPNVPGPTCDIALPRLGPARTPQQLYSII